jgi:aspartate aminotransferase-like enzyme
MNCDNAAVRHDLEPIRFFLPGPAYVTEETRRAMLRPVVAHRSSDFLELYARLTSRLASVFRTERPVPFATGSATLVMEIALSSLAPRRVLALTNGAFSERWNAIATSLGKAADRVSVPWGRPMDPDLVRQALRQAATAGGGGYDAVTLVHNETSTGVVSPVEEIARVVREESDALVLVDAVSSLGGGRFETDAWGVDLVLTGSQKALAAPPGLVPFAVSARAEERAATVEPRGFYTDLLRYLEYHRDSGSTITTPAIPVAYALDLQLQRIEEEGIEERWERHRAMRRRTERWAEQEGGAERGFRLAVAAEHADARSDTISCLLPPGGPSGFTAPDLVRALGRRGFTVASGYGGWKPTTFRIGHMGEVRESDLERLFEAIEEASDELARGKDVR